MATYTGLKQSFTPGAVASDASRYVFGLSFKVTSANMQLDGWWWWCDIAGGQASTAEDFGLWTSTGTGTGAYVTGSKVTSGTFVQGWNFVSCSSPIALTSGQEYRAVKTSDRAATGSNCYTAVSHFFDTGSGSAGAVNGPLTIFAKNGATTNPEPHGDGQMVFLGGGTAPDVTTVYPITEFNQTWYGMDVQVSDVAGGGQTVNLTTAQETIAAPAPSLYSQVALPVAQQSLSALALAPRLQLTLAVARVAVAAHPVIVSGGNLPPLGAGAGGTVTQPGYGGSVTSGTFGGEVS
jgi:hypothetical protein